MSDIRKLSRPLSIQATTALSRQADMPAKKFGENKPIQLSMSCFNILWINFTQHSLFRGSWGKIVPWLLAWEKDGGGCSENEEWEKIMTML